MEDDIALYDVLISRMIRSAIGSKRAFLPNGAITQLIKESSVRKALDFGSPSSEDEDALVKFAVRDAPRMLLLHLLCEKEQPDADDLQSTLKLFREHGFDDGALPLQITRVCAACTQSKDKTRPSGRLCLRPAPTVSQQQGPRVCLRRALSLKSASVDALVDSQWSFLAPTFTTEQFVYNLQAEEILPIYDRDFKKTEGHFSTVFRAKLRNDHQIVLKTDHERDSVDVAVKKMKPAAARSPEELRNAWAIEADNCEDLKRINHDHIVRPVAAFEQNNSYYLIFDWAEEGTLCDFWAKVDNRPRLSPELTKTVLQQLCGLADAIDKFHKDKTEPTLIDTHFNPQQTERIMQPTVPVPSATLQSSNNLAASSEAIPVLNLETPDGVRASPSVDDAALDLHVRHGDIKPANIFIKRENGPGLSGLGTLLIGDWGLARKHDRATMHRVVPSTRNMGTHTYEPPEAITGRGGVKSRQYDIWSMGCIILEFVIWLLHGQPGLQAFYDHENLVHGETLYYKTLNPDHTEADVSDITKEFINQLLEDPECKGSGPSAIRDLLLLVQKGLLVVALPNSPAHTTGPFRYQAKDMKAELERIYNKILILGNESYASTGSKRDHVEIPKRSAPGKLSHTLTVGANLPRRVRQRDTYSREPLNSDWTFVSTERDIKARVQIVNALITTPGGLQPFFPSQATHTCMPCAALDLSLDNIQFDRRRAELRRGAASCQICNLLDKACSRIGVVSSDPVTFSKHKSTITANGQRKPAVLVCTSPRTTVRQIAVDIQRCLPLVVESPDAEAHYALVKGWLKECDESHLDCQPDHSVLGAPALPKRLLCIGAIGSPSIRLVDAINIPLPSRKRLKYVAFSHRWAGKAASDAFPSAVTTAANYAKHAQSIAINDLPGTFKDAVTVARALGPGYLWIDSLCLIQGDLGEFQEESKSMGSVYSNAYCTISAIAAADSSKPFLSKRRKRTVVKLDGKGGSEASPLYLCDATDDFQQDVLDAALNRRGWVLQEHALSRRTIFYTSTQAYFECGHGVRCETLTRMANKQAEFLGDPNFPQIWEESTKGQAISFYESLFKQYSRLELSHISDRPFAIAGLEQRLVQTLSNTGGGFCVFKNYLGRSLLWHRGNDETNMSKIDHPPTSDYNVPSWSWLDVAGGIDFVPVPDGQVRWSTDIKTPVAWGGKQDPSATADRRGDISMIVTGRICDVQEHEENTLLIFDRPSEPRHAALRCVVVGELGSGTDDRAPTCYVLCIAPRFDNEALPWERVGAGYLPRSCINFNDAHAKNITLQ